MTVNTVGILSPGDMGHAVGRALGEHGFDVITCLQGRSDRTRQLAQSARITDVPAYEDLVGQSDLLLSILVPAEAVSVARRVAAAISARGANTAFADCNATSPMTAQVIEPIITAAGGRFIDASIIGGPPRNGSTPQFYVSGPHTEVIGELDGKGIVVRPIGEAIGRASALKMCYAALTKGRSSLNVAVLTAAQALGLSDELRTQLMESQADVYAGMEAQVPGLPADSGRWIGEMEEIADTFEFAGVTPLFHRGAAELFRLLSETPFAQETRETVDRNRTLQQTIEVVAQHLPPGVRSEDQSN